VSNLAVECSFADSYHEESKKADYVIPPNDLGIDDDAKGSDVSGASANYLLGDSPTISGQEQKKTNEFIRSKEKEFKYEVVHALNEESIEDGYSHPAENILKETIMMCLPYAVTWIQSLYIENINNHKLAAGILRCIGRLNSNMTKPWGSIMVTGALFHSNVEVREAAVRAIEMWEDYSIIEYLEQREEKVPWLSNYIKQVIKDLKR
jgi:hypothetical protein